MSTQVPESFPGADWEEALARIDASLRHALAHTPEPPELPAEGPARAGGAEALDARLGGLRAALGVAEQTAREVEAVLAEEARACEAWLNAAREVRQRHGPR